MKTAVDLSMTGDTVRWPAGTQTGYDSTKHNFGSIFCQGTDTWTGTKTFIGPGPIQVAKPMETAIATAAGFPHAIQIGKYEWAVVLGDNSTAATLRKFLLFIYRADLGTFTYRGAISYTWATAATVRGLRLQRTVTTTGTASCSGTAVTGSGTDWFTKRISAGSRIGFGSTDPDLITTWYDLAPATALTTNASLTLASSAGTVGLGPYIIEDYSLIVAVTTATTLTNGGLWVFKGLSLSTACWSGTATATVIALAGSVDNLRLIYWIKDTGTITNTIAAGLALDDVSTDNLTQDCYVLDGAGTTAKIYKYNVKAALTLTTGAATNAFTLATGAPTVVGNTSQIHNCRIGTLKHGVGSSVKSLYFTTAARIYRCALAGITSGSTTFLNDSMNETPTGGVNTLPGTVGAGMSTLEIFDSMDRIGWFSTSATAFRSYVTKYMDATQHDHIWLGDSKLTHATAGTATAYPYPNTSSTLMSSWGGEAGMVFLARHGTSALLNQVYAVPIGAHWGYQGINNNYQFYVTPAIATPACSKYWRLCVNHAQQLGDDNLGVVPEGFKVYYRTSGITDNLGAWQSLPIDWDMSGLVASATIQFKFEFKILSMTCVPARIFSISVLYEVADDIPSDLRWNMDDSNTTDGTVGFIQQTSFSVFPSVIQIDYYRSDNNSNVLTQLSSGTTNGTFQYHNGATWVAGLGTNTIGMRRRFVPTAGLPNGVAVYPKITVIS